MKITKEWTYNIAYFLTGILWGLSFSIWNLKSDSMIFVIATFGVIILLFLTFGLQYFLFYRIKPEE